VSSYHQLTEKMCHWKPAWRGCLGRG